MFATDKRGQRVNLNLIESGHYTGDAEWAGWTADGTKYLFSADPTTWAAYAFSAQGKGIAFCYDENGMYELPVDLIGWCVDETLRYPTPIFADGSSSDEENTLLIAVEVGSRWLVGVGEFGTYYETLHGVREAAKKQFAEIRK